MMKKIFLFSLALLICSQAMAQIKVSGTILDGAYNNEPMIGANVMVKGTMIGTATEADGKFSLNAPSEQSVLVFSAIGYKSQEITVGKNTIFNVTMTEDSEKLEELVVVGYGTQKKKLVTGATTQVKGEKLEQMNTTSAFTALQSQTPGMNITQSSGQPGEGFKVTIRGMGTIGNSAPLYVIDGVAGGDINNLNPADIESLDVLKDAASAAIYGSRAANGVVLVTTKQGKAGKISVSYDGYYGVQNVYKMPDLLNAKQYMEVMNQIGFNQGNDIVYNWLDYMPADRYNAYMNGSDKGTNWLDAMRNKNAPIQNHSINLTGGSDFSKFALGVSYTNQEGIFGKPVQSEYERTTVRLNSDHVIYKNKNDMDVVTFGETLFYTYKVSSGIGIGNQFWNDISNALRAYPIVPIYNSDGSDYYLWKDMTADGLSGYNSSTANPIADMVANRGHNRSKNHNLNMSAYLKIQPIKNLILKSQFGYKYSSSSYRSYTAKAIINQTTQNLVDKVSQNGGMGWNYTWENTANYKFDLASNHHFDVLVGQSIEKSGLGEDWEGNSSNLLFPGWDYAWLTNGQSTSPTVSGAPWGESSIASFFGRINYDYKETYMLTAIMRADGSSNFARGKRWGYFPSVSAGWVVSNEKFMEKTSDWLDFLKIRASWGQNGNCGIDNFQYLATVSFGATAAYTFGNNVTSYLQGSYPDILPNPDVTWETSEQLDLGFDARFLRNRLNVAFDYYTKKTKDWLVRAPILATAGTNAPYINGGDIENKGFELALGWSDKIGQDFTYGVNLNIAKNKNEVTRIAGNGIIYGPSNVLSQGITDEVYRVEVGHPVGYFIGYKTAGVFQNQEDIDQWIASGHPVLQTKPQPGDLKFVDVNGDGKIDVDPNSATNDRTQIGDPNPDWNLGFSFNVGYKGFDLSVTTYGNFGQQNIRSYRKFMDGRQENYTTEVYSYWHGEGTSNKYPRLTAGNTGVNWRYISDIYVENSDFLRIQNVTLGYDLKNIWKKCPFQKLRVYASVQNLFTFTGYKGMDPEIGTSANTEDLDGNGTADYEWAKGVDVGFYPSPRTVLFGVNIKF